MKEIWFIRHGESLANAGLPTDFPDSIALTALGQRQAVRISEQFERRPDLIVMSPYIRTQQTAAPTIGRFANVPTEILPLQEFDYLCPQKCKGTTPEVRRPWAEEYWDRCDPLYCDGVTVESFASFGKRIMEQLDLLSSRQEQYIAAFVHGQVIRAILQHLATGQKQLDMAYFRDNMLPLEVGNGSVLSCRYQSGKWQEPAFLNFST